jgi:hypothetical protein
MVLQQTFRVVRSYSIVYQGMRLDVFSVMSGKTFYYGLWRHLVWYKVTDISTESIVSIFSLK